MVPGVPCPDFAGSRPYRPDTAPDPKLVLETRLGGIISAMPSGRREMKVCFECLSSRKIN